MLIRRAVPEDAGQIIGIYAYYVLETAVTYEEEVPSEEEFRKRMEHTLERYPYFVAEEGGRILGYAYAGAFHVRSAYRWSSEVTVYVGHDSVGRGLGRALYEALEAALSEMGILNLYACIAYPEKEDGYLTRNSESFHAHMGYKLIGRFHRCAYKFGRWYDMIWMEKHIGRHVRGPREVSSWKG